MLVRSHLRVRLVSALLLRRRACFFFKDTATTGTYTLSLHDALPICSLRLRSRRGSRAQSAATPPPSYKRDGWQRTDRKSTRLNSSHRCISYAVFCLKKKTNAPSLSLSSSGKSVILTELKCFQT